MLHFTRPSPKFSLPRSLFVILLSTIVISGIPAFAWHLYSYYHWKNRYNPAYLITKIIQTGPQKEVLKTEYLAELMGLSVNYPVNLFAFDLEKARQDLLNSPVIKSAQVIKKKPDTVYVDYQVREPIAIVEDFDNALIDSEGFIFPQVPFYSPRRIPEIYFGFEEKIGQFYLENHTVYVRQKLSKYLLESLKNLKELLVDTEIIRIDLSNVYAESLGKRELLLELKRAKDKQSNVFYHHILRLDPSRYMQNVRDYLLYCHTVSFPFNEKNDLKKGAREDLLSFLVLDFRIPDLAFVKKI